MRRGLPGYATAAICAIFFALLPFALSDYHRGIAAEVAVYLIAILGLDVLVGYTGQISIGHSAFMMIGGYTTAIMSHYHHTNLIATMPLAFAITFGCGVLLGLPALRLSGVYLALATFALAVSVPQLPLKFSKFTNGSAGISANHSVSNTWLYGVSWATAAVAFAFTWLVLRGRTGRAFRAIRDSEVAATSSGVTLAIYKTLAFGVSAALAGVAGSLFVLVTNGFAQPNEFSVTLSLKILIGAAVAGLGSLWGVLIGAAFIALLPSISASAPLIGSAHGQDVVFGIFVIVVMLLLPTGVAGLLPRLRRLRSRLD
ncbi:MAG TPA: branched-chain amino acid ABC transporter permease [Gaiellaceae bacterium]|nr:branched-chain amino acid ABC transporter permease [Gaiellaceae bacterium]